MRLEGVNKELYLMWFVRQIKIIVHYLEACNRKDTVLYSVKSKLFNICMSGYNVTRIDPFYVRLQDGTDGLILYSSNVIKLYLEGVCFHCLTGKRSSSFLRGLRQSLQINIGMVPRLRHDSVSFLSKSSFTNYFAINVI